MPSFPTVTFLMNSPVSIFHHLNSARTFSSRSFVEVWIFVSRNSVLSVMMDLPSGENVSDQIGPSKPVIVRCNLPVAVCHSSTRPKCLAALPSLLATAAVSPSGATATSTSGTFRTSTGVRQTWAEVTVTKNSTPRKSLVHICRGTIPYDENRRPVQKHPVVTRKNGSADCTFLRFFVVGMALLFLTHARMRHRISDSACCVTETFSHHLPYFSGEPPCPLKKRLKKPRRNPQTA